MVKDTRVVVGSFDTVDKVKTILRELKTGGYKKEDITLYADEKRMEKLRNAEDIDVKTDKVADVSKTENQKNTEDDGSFWGQVKDLFTTDTAGDTYLSDQEGPDNKELLKAYQDDIKNGNIVVVVNNYRGDIDTAIVYENDAETNVGQTSVKDADDNLTEDEKLKLKEERLQVDKEEVEAGEVNVRKETKHDTETVEVPVEHEEVVVERKPVTGKDTKATEGIDEETESYNIPVKEEKVTVDKEPVVKEEVEIKKKRDQDVETVSEDVKREELDVEAEGDVEVEDMNNNRKSNKKPNKKSNK